jgi:hypothetical protein
LGEAGCDGRSVVVSRDTLERRFSKIEERKPPPGWDIGDGWVDTLPGESVAASHERSVSVTACCATPAPRQCAAKIYFDFGSDS